MDGRWYLPTGGSWYQSYLTFLWVNPQLTEITSGGVLLLYGCIAWLVDKAKTSLLKCLSSTVMTGCYFEPCIGIHKRSVRRRGFCKARVYEFMVKVSLFTTKHFFFLMHFPSLKARRPLQEERVLFSLPDYYQFLMVPYPNPPYLPWNMVSTTSQGNRQAAVLPGTWRGLNPEPQGQKSDLLTNYATMKMV